MNDILKMLKEFEHEIIMVVRDVMSSSNGINVKTGENTLVGSRIFSEMHSDIKDNELILFYINDYIDYIESGRKPGSFPPPHVIADWCARKGLPTDNRTVYAICYAIYRDGIAARPIMGDAFEMLDEYFDGWADRVFNVLTEFFDSFFE